MSAPGEAKTGVESHFLDPVGLVWFVSSARSINYRFE